jgi:hypothetical protein
MDGRKVSAMDFESLFPHPVLLISGTVLGILWAITSVKIKGVKLSTSKVWTGIRPVVAIILGIGASFIPGTFSDEFNTGHRILFGAWSGFLGGLWFMAGIANAFAKWAKGKFSSPKGEGK